MTRLESIRNNTFLLGLDMNRATKEQKIQMLCQMIDNETDKPEDEIDFALIGECSAYLRELSDKAAEATKEQKRRILQQIKTHHNQTATKTAKVLRPNWRKMGRIVAIAAAVATILVSTLTVLAKVNGYSNAWEYVKENIQKIIGLDAGDRVNEGNITLTKQDGVVTYNSIEELLKKEGYDIMYPAVLPDGVGILQLYHHVVNEEHTVYSFVFTDTDLSLAISSIPSISAEDLKKHERIEANAMSAYLIEKENGDYQLIGYDGKYEYLICYNNREMLIEIFSSMKGIKK
ncbi:MAG: hypothetical protein E7659_07310 [Ruminococcaceae bacterium]|nr:hypothetical protein [Oscillospiraceae bacterium]